MTPQEAAVRLEAALAALDRQDETTEADSAPVELDQTSVGRLSRMDAMRVQAMAMAGRQRREMERRRIHAALARIAAGDFGYCVNCGEPIAPRRLDLDPALPNCVQCSSGGG
ncbi:MAG: TraR/DksA C4-type zinc finger protein [Phenylobacterium sp.]|uniref:TraR/DksA family transcriptional regulator n=1 Tax=Phenylobacterium sp. TaxID=1871053 RepID=UPI0027216A35|nr:TraR/DksA C4-type zinc finger protein [Phenylobacterium sp.]MDO8900425.1 TraR/DksA C4-type zinc finger protein [Phenylobacterium sp.]